MKRPNQLLSWKVNHLHKFFSRRRKALKKYYCDASEEAFRVCVYIHLELEDGNYDVRFVTAKSRVAPLKKLTLPNWSSKLQWLLLDLMQPSEKRPH